MMVDIECLMASYSCLPISMPDRTGCQQSKAERAGKEKKVKISSHLAPRYKIRVSIPAGLTDDRVGATCVLVSL